MNDPKVAMIDHRGAVSDMKLSDMAWVEQGFFGGGGGFVQIFELES